MNDCLLIERIWECWWWWQQFTMDWWQRQHDWMMRCCWHCDAGADRDVSVAANLRLTWVLLFCPCRTWGKWWRACRLVVHVIAVYEEGVKGRIGFVVMVTWCVWDDWDWGYVLKLFCKFDLPYMYILLWEKLLWISQFNY